MDLIPDFVPSGYRTLNVYLVVNDADKALRFYNSVFDADTTMELRDPSGRISHAEFKIYDTTVMLTEDKTVQPSGGVILHLYVGDAEAVFDACVDAGCEVVYPLKKQFYGDKSGRVKDPFGHQWIIARHLETLSPAELKRRFDELYN